MLTNLYSYIINKFKKNDISISDNNLNEKNNLEKNVDGTFYENIELEKEIINNTSKKIVVRNYDQKVIKDVKIKEKNACFVTYPCLHDVILIFDDNTYEDTTMNIIVLYEIWKNISFDINIKFLKHCKNEHEINEINNQENNLVENLFLNKYTII
jgi:hypothetical protein